MKIKTLFIGLMCFTALCSLSDTGVASLQKGDIQTAQLIEAIENNDLAAVEEILKNNPSCVNGCPSSKEKPLKVACRYGPKVPSAVSHTCTTCGCDGKRCTHPLHAEFEKVVEKLDEVRYAIMSALIRGGADLDAQDNDGYTALHYACCMNNNPRKAALLVYAGADVNLQGHNGRTPIMEAIIDRSIEVVRFLITHGADLRLCDDQGRTPLMYVADYCNNIELTDLMLQSGSVVNAQDKEGRTALDIAISRQHTDTADHLLLQLVF